MHTGNDFLFSPIKSGTQSTEGTWDLTQEKELFKQELHFTTSSIHSPSFTDQRVQLFNLSCKAEVVRSMLTARKCCSVGKQPHLLREASETISVENHQQPNSIQLAPPAHPTRLAYPARRARAEEGTWEAAERKGKEQSTKRCSQGQSRTSSEGTGEEAKHQKQTADRAV